jgi:hypothetical protein
MTGVKPFHAEMLNNMKKVGVDTVYTLVNWRDWGSSSVL